MSNKLRYNYYSVKLVDKKTNKEELFYINKWIENYEESIKKDIIIPVGDFSCKIEKDFYTEKNKGFLICKIYKLRLNKAIAKIREYEETDFIELDENEYMGEETMFLYDLNENIIMTQMNRYSLSIKNLERLFEIDPNKEVKFTPLLKDINEYKEIYNNCRKMELTLKNIWDIPEDISENMEDGIKNYIENARTFKAESASLVLSVGRAKNKFLNNDKIRKIIEGIAMGKKYYSKAKATHYKDGKTEIIDILKLILSDTIEYEIDPRGTINFDEAKLKMIECYERRFKIEVQS